MYNIRPNFGKIVGKCDKCNGDVHYGNSARNLDFYTSEIKIEKLSLIFASDRHIAPTEKCEGSPSRYQYFNEKRSTNYPYNNEYEQRIREAYVKMIESYSEKI